MRKMILIIGLALVAGLIMLGCAQPAKTIDKTAKPEPAKSQVTIEEPAKTTTDPAAEPGTTTTTTEPSKATTTTTTTTKTTTKATSTVTQADLDKLKAGIEGIETDDLAGLSNE